MSKPRRINKSYVGCASIAERAYLAGILDGEGCISVGVRLTKYITPTVQVSNTSEALINWLCDRYGGGKYINIDKRLTRKTLYLWTVAGRKAQDVVRDAHEFLIIKRKQADIILNIPRFEPGHDENGKVVSSMTEGDFAKNKDIIRSIRALNKRGRQI